MQLSYGLETAVAGKASVIGFCFARRRNAGENPSLMRATDDRTIAGNKRARGHVWQEMRGDTLTDAGDCRSETLKARN